MKAMVIVLALASQTDLEHLPTVSCEAVRMIAGDISESDAIQRARAMGIAKEIIEHYRSVWRKCNRRRT